MKKQDSSKPKSPAKQEGTDVAKPKLESQLLATKKDDRTATTVPKDKPESGSGSKSRVTQDITFYCFDVLIASLNHLPMPEAANFSNDPFPLFVTWKKGPDHKLRGCIGTFRPLPLHIGLQQYALDSALRDSRFSPIQTKEVPHLQVTVSLLTNFEVIEKYWEWTIGVHGIQIEFMENGLKKSATFLPEVALEQEWSQVETIDALLRKGEFEGSITPAVRSEIKKITRYQSEKLTTTYEEYERIRRETNAAVFNKE